MRSWLSLICVAALTIACGRADDRQSAPVAPPAPPPVASSDGLAERLAPSIAALDRNPSKEKELRDPFASYAWDCYDCGGPDSDATDNGSRVRVPFGKTPINELKVFGTVVDGGERSALIGDATGRTLVVGLGSRIGRSDSGDDGPTTWKIDRIQSGEVTVVSAPPPGSSEAPSRVSLTSHRG